MYRVGDDIKVEFNNDILNFLGNDTNVMLSEISNSDRVYMMMLLKNII